MHVKTWHVEVFLSEEDDITHARAVLSSDRPGVLSSSGSARRNPRDANVPEIGDEVAVGRALCALGNQLANVASEDIDAMAGATFRIN